MFHLGLTETHFMDRICFRTIDGDLTLTGPSEIKGGNVQTTSCLYYKSPFLELSKSGSTYVSQTGTNSSPLNHFKM